MLKAEKLGALRWLLHFYLIWSSCFIEGFGSSFCFFMFYVIVNWYNCKPLLFFVIYYASKLNVIERLLFKHNKTCEYVAVGNYNIFLTFFETKRLSKKIIILLIDTENNRWKYSCGPNKFNSIAWLVSGSFGKMHWGNTACVCGGLSRGPQPRAP